MKSTRFFKVPIEAYTVEELKILLNPYRGLETLEKFSSMSLVGEG